MLRTVTHGARKYPNLKLVLFQVPTPASYLKSGGKAVVIRSQPESFQQHSAPAIAAAHRENLQHPQGLGGRLLVPAMSRSSML
jgi:hypothetical protein